MKRIFTSRYYLLFMCTFLSMGGTVQAQSLKDDVSIIAADHDLMGGIVMVYCSNENIEVIPFGLADLERNIKVTDSTAFRIASISKTITAIAIMQLVEGGDIDLDTDASDYLGFDLKNPNYPTKHITTRMLLSHRSTIFDGPTYSSFLSNAYNANPIPPISDLLQDGGAYYTTQQFNNTEPGKYFQYANINYGILGTIVEAVSGERFDEYVLNHIMIPLGLQGSFNVNHIENIDNVAVLYRKQNGVWVPQVDNYQGVQPVFNNLDSYTIGSNGARFGPQGGLRISGKDLAKLFRLFLNEGTVDGTQILNSESIQSMMNPEWTYNGSNGNNYYGLFNSWGLGIHISTNTNNSDEVLEALPPMLGHPGEAYGLVSDAYVSPENNLGIIFMTNGNGSGYTTGNSSVFYTVEKEIFNAINSYDFPLTCQLSSISDFPIKEVDLFPNPVDSVLMIESLGTIEGKALIYDLQGKLILSQNITDGKAIYGLDQLKAGTYFVQLENQQALYRFIKK